jgi:endonuclease YncB( thermonuclease family)
LVTIALTMAAACAVAADRVQAASSGSKQAAASRVITGHATVVDGDGLEINGTKIRLFGIDAPKIDQYCQRDDHTRWRCGHYSSVELDRLVASHDVTCTVRTLDQYDRTVATCRVGDVDVGESQVRNGWAVAYRKFTKDYVDEEDAARTAKRGVWRGAFEMPWIWRERSRHTHYP